MPASGYTTVHADVLFLTTYLYDNIFLKRWKFPIPEPVRIVCLLNIRVHYARQTRDIYQVLPYSIDFKASQELYCRLRKTVLSKCSFISTEGPVSILNYRKALK